jgi:uncharacterized protein YdhG (YjbR/CyaY superfamily)
MNTKPDTIDAYIDSFPAEIQVKLQRIRSAIKAAAPEAQEAISYAMPTFKLQGNLVHFAAYRQHIGFYPAPSGLEAFKVEISSYKHSKGAVQFPLDQALPLDLIQKIVHFRVTENLTKARLKAAQKRKKT